MLLFSLFEFGCRGHSIKAVTAFLFSNSLGTVVLRIPYVSCYCLLSIIFELFSNCFSWDYFISLVLQLSFDVVLRKELRLYFSLPCDLFQVNESSNVPDKLFVNVYGYLQKRLRRSSFALY